MDDTTVIVARPSSAALKNPFVLLVLVGVVAALALFPGLGMFGIFDPSDGLYMECAREMLELKDWCTPNFNYQPFFEKPILIYWMMASCFKIFGISEWSARLASAIPAMLTVVIVYVFTRAPATRKRLTKAGTASEITSSMSPSIGSPVRMTSRIDGGIWADCGSIWCG